MKVRTNLAVALMLIGIGSWFLAVEISPALKSFAYGADTWPIPILGIGAGIALIGLFTWVPGLMVPACIVAGVGGLLYYQNTSGDWESWAYAWTLIPGFVGFGVLLSGLLSRKRGGIAGGLWTIFSSVVMLAVFGSFLGGWSLIRQLWPLLIIFLGIVILFRALFRRR